MTGPGTAGGPDTAGGRAETAGGAETALPCGRAANTAFAAMFAALHLSLTELGGGASRFLSDPHSIA